MSYRTYRLCAPVILDLPFLSFLIVVHVDGRLQRVRLKPATAWNQWTSTKRVRCSLPDYPSPEGIPSGSMLALFPIGFALWTYFGGGLRPLNKVHDYRNHYWRVRYSDHNWKELTSR